MIIGIHGFKQSGKDTLADLMVEEFGFKKVAFADKLKNALHLLFNVPKQNLWGSDEDKMKLTEVKWTSLNNINRENRQDSTYLSVRELMQIFATEVCRTSIPGIWYEYLDINEQENIVVSDVRFDNEAEFLKSKNAYVIKVKRKCATSTAHESEKGITDDLMDKIFENNGTLDEFLEKSRAELKTWIQTLK